MSEPESPVRRLVETARQLGALARIWESLAPNGLARYSRIGRLDHDVLTLYADNGAIAAKLIQQLPSLVTKFRQRGVEINGIRVDVQVKVALRGVSASPKKPVSPAALAKIEEFSDSLPESKLKEALTNLLTHQRRS